MYIVIFFNNTKKQLNFPGLPGAAGTAPTGTAKNNQDQIRGERPGPGGMFSNRDRDGSPQGAGRSAGSGAGERVSAWRGFLHILLQCAASQFFPSGTQGASCGIWAGSGVTFPTLSRSRASSLRRASFRCAGGKAPQPGGVPAAPGSGTMHEGLFVSSPDWGRSASKNN